jgi:hypothetical protein
MISRVRVGAEKGTRHASGYQQPVDLDEHTEDDVKVSEYSGKDIWSGKT